MAIMNEKELLEVAYEALTRCLFLIEEVRLSDGRKIGEKRFMDAPKEGADQFAIAARYQIGEHLYPEKDLAKRVAGLGVFS